jgi:hypothetical protein
MRMPWLKIPDRLPTASQPLRLRVAGGALRPKEPIDSGDRGLSGMRAGEKSEGRGQKGKAQPTLAATKALRICRGRRSGRLAGHELLAAVLPIINELVSAQEQQGADGRLIESGGVEDVGNGRPRARAISRGKADLRDATIGKGNVDLHKKEEAGEWAALAKTGLGLLGLGGGAPNETLILSKLPPAFRDRAERPTDSDLGRGAGIVRDKRRVTVLAIAVALPDGIPAFP